jgi:hypothetical protein
MDPDLKEMLDRRAEDMRLSPDLPPLTLRRAHRRRGWSVAFASMTLVAVIAGTVVALQTFGTSTTHRIGQSPAPQPTKANPAPTPPGPNASSGPAPTSGPPPTTGPATTGSGGGAPPAIDRALWPVVTPARLRDLGRDVAAGRADYALRVDTEATEFAIRMLGWPADRVSFEGSADGIVYRGVPGVQAIVQNADLGPSTALIVHLEPASAGGRRVWLVVGVQSELFNVLCPPLHQPTLHVCGAVAPTWAVPAIASATVEYVESEMQPSEAQSIAAIRVNGIAFHGRLQFNAAYANSDVSFVVRMMGSDGTVLGMEARRLRVA